VRPETAADVDAVRAVHVAAFPSPLESRLVDALRRAGKAVISLVAELDQSVVGHVLFSDVSIARGVQRGIGLAPVAVLPRAQRRGIGSQLIRAGLTGAVELGYDFAVVLGEPAYYRRFGFETARRSGLTSEYGVDAPFMTLALHPHGLRGASGRVTYQPEFSLVTL
jgi:putative acetyltransferase